MDTLPTDGQLYRRRDAANVLAVSESQLVKWERIGWLTPIHIPGIRALRYDGAEVRALAARIIQAGKQARATAA